MALNLDDDARVIQYTGLTSREVHLLVTGLNGIDLGDLRIMADFPALLAGSMAGEAESAFADYEEFGCNLGMPANDSPEVPYEYSDLAEKLQKLTQEQAAFLIGFSAGFWEARRIP